MMANCLIRLLIVLFGLCIPGALFATAAMASEPPYKTSKTITVGVRGDARPFSYLSPAQADEELLPGYSGYMIEICRRVLSEMIVNGPFAGYTVDFKKVTTDSRLQELDDGQVDMLCGPDSVTLGRLYKYNTSHPLFLSGITYATVQNDQFPRGHYCNAVLGLVSGTTAETEGLRKLAESNALQLYDSALEQFLAVYVNSDRSQPPAQLLQRIRVLKEGLSSGFSTADNQARGVNKIEDPALVKTVSCPNGFNHGPVVFYSSHQQGIEDLCKGRILFYIADVDILSDRVAACDVILHRETMTREAYSVFFRRDTNVLLDRPVVASANYFPDNALYAEFNNVLIRKMQTTENILDYEFANEFKSESPTEDLQAFFDGYKFVVDF